MDFNKHLPDHQRSSIPVVQKLDNPFTGKNRLSRKKGFLLWRNSHENRMTLLGAPPPPLEHPPVAIMPDYLYTYMREISCTGNSEASHAPPLPTGAGLAQGGRSSP
jgi:hypothetical protein